MNREILGDKKKRRYDEGLIDIVNKKFAEEQKRESESSGVVDLEKIKKITSDGRLNYELFNPPNERKIVVEWNDFFNQAEYKKKGIFLASMPNYYELFKQVLGKINSGDSALIKKGIEELNDFRRDFGSNDHKKLLLSSTKIEKRGELLDICHHSDCWNGTLYSSCDACTLYPSLSIDEFCRLGHGEEFIKGLFDTKDSIEIIIDVLEGISNTFREKILIVTPLNLNSADHYTAYFCKNDDFVIGCDATDAGSWGYCRGINYNWKEDDEIS